MEMRTSLLLTSLVLVGLLSHTTQAITHGNCEGSSRCTYIVRVRPPPNFSMDMSPMNLEDWYRSFLPPRMARSKPQSPFIHTYREAILGFAVNLTKDEAGYIKTKDEVLMVYQDNLIPLLTTHTPDFLSLRPNGGAWNSLGMGEGIIIGLLDTGIDFAHTSFDDAGMATPPAKWRGSCKFGSVQCNKKLIGGKSLIGGENNPEAPQDDVGHGTHTASTAAGRFVQGASVLGSGNGTAAGMAPRAHVAMYKVCNAQGCYGADIVAGMEAAIADGVDILSISLGGRPQAFHEDIIAIGSFSAMKKGIFVSCSAGNSGPFPSTLSNEEPWVLTVGASTMDRQMKAIVKLGDGRSFVGESAYQPSNLASLPLMFEDGSVNITGKVVASELEGSQVEIGQFIKDTGGAGVILLGAEDSGHTTFAAAHVLPASYLNSPDAAAVRQYIKTSNKPTASIIFNGTSLGTTLAPVVAYFSSRGPSTASPGILKPDIIGPGVNVIAAWPFNVGPNTVGEHDKVFNSISGTSMSAPHLSGIAAIIKSAHPDWSPAAIKSAIMTTAYVVYDNKKPILDEKLSRAGHFTIGAGHVNPSAVVNPGLVYDTDVEQYILYLCGLGYTDSEVEIITHQKGICNNGTKIAEAELNYPSIATRATAGKLVVNRTVTNVGDAVSSYTVEIDMPKEVQAAVSPTKLEFTKAKETKTFTVSLSWDGSKIKNAEGSFKWVSSKHVVRSPIVIF
ncbi:Subtilisin-like protease SBT1.2 [Dichanthelium oligosanthes]|uniref:Subtilisin-like protease SBT1.2 n=1 Tax=Dichanthelium oligosanthes TaxID=888268 RepID=A0A1E5VRP7_9POAL|nr:Subtilisin-like protease SBT1.2 [Dichanthelium oligosanthes]